MPHVRLIVNSLCSSGSRRGRRGPFGARRRGGVAPARGFTEFTHREHLNVHGNFWRRIEVRPPGVLVQSRVNGSTH
jgi:hypothetical protein